MRWKARPPSSCARRARPRARRSSSAKSAAWIRRRSSATSTARWCSTAPPKGWARPFDPDAFRGVKLLEPLVDAATGEVVAEADAKLTARQARRIAENTKEVLVGRADLLGRFVAEDLVNDGNRRDLRRGRRGTGRGAAGRAGGGGHHHAADAGGRPVQRPVDPQHAGGGQEHQPRRRADRHLSRHAPGRAADAGDRRGAVPRPVLRPRPLRPVRGRPREDEHAAGLQRRARHRCACCARKTCCARSRRSAS